MLRKHVIPVVKGPKDRYFVIDHHHLCRALQAAGSDKVLVTVVLNLQRLDKDEFWVFMDNRGLVHPFDEKGKRQAYSDIPKSIEDMIDDPFRSLAGALRRKGGYAKDTTPFSEFLWADFLRRRLSRRGEKGFRRGARRRVGPRQENRRRSPARLVRPHRGGILSRRLRFCTRNR